FSQVRTPFPNEDRDVHRRIVAGINAERLFTEEDDRTDVTFFVTIHSAGFGATLHHVFLGERTSEPDDYRRYEEAQNMVFKTENGTPAGGLFIGADSFEGARSVMEGVGKEADARLFGGDDFTVEPDLRSACGHAGELLLPCIRLK